MVARKRAAAIAALCVLLLLMLSRPSHQEFSDYFCACYKECYPGCQHVLPSLCKVVCGGSCNNDYEVDPVDSCMFACTTDSVCGLPPVPHGGGADYCSKTCNLYWPSEVASSKVPAKEP